MTKALSRAGLEPALLGAKERSSFLPFILIVTFVNPVPPTRVGTSGGRLS